MSKVIQKVTDRPWAAFVEAEGKNYYIDSAWTIDHGLETMVFEVENLEKATKTVADGINWGGIYEKRYETTDEMVKNHQFLLENLESVLKK